MRLPDALLVRDAWMGGDLRERTYNGRRYGAVSIWADVEGARTAAGAIRAMGTFARVTRERRPHRASSPRIYGRRSVGRPRKTNVCSPPSPRWMWVVWSAEKPACAGQMEGPAE